MKQQIEFISKLEIALQHNLPGRRAHLEMAPENRIESLLRETSQDEPDARKAAVLILLYQVEEEWNTVCIKRPLYDGVHSGQIAFPGGRYELTDKDLIETALREAEEEIGVRQQDVKVLGRLTELYIPPSNYLILPVVGSIEYIPEFIPQEKEVAGMLQISLNTLFDPQTRSVVLITEPEGSTFQAPCYTIAEDHIWGATAMVINELKIICQNQDETVL